MSLRLVCDPWPFNPVALQEFLEALPGGAALLTPAVEPFPQDVQRLGEEGFQAVVVPDDPVVVVVAPPCRVEDSKESLQRQAAVPSTPLRAVHHGSVELLARRPTFHHLLSLATPFPAQCQTEKVNTRSCLEATASDDPRLFR